MNKQAQTGILSLFFLLGVFVVVWAFFLGGFLAQIGAQAISANSLTGFEAFIWGNLNFAVLLGVLAASAGGLYFGGAQQ